MPGIDFRARDKAVLVDRHQSGKEQEVTGADRSRNPLIADKLVLGGVLVEFNSLNERRCAVTDADQGDADPVFAIALRVYRARRVVPVSSCA